MATPDLVDAAGPGVEVLIRRVAEPYGGLGNMSPHPIVYRGDEYRTAEALFQCLRFDDEAIQTRIWEQSSPMAAKMIAKKHRDLMVVPPQSERDLENMQLVIGLKTDQHAEIERMLLETGDRAILEDCTKRASASGLFWGAARRDSHWEGSNWLGRLWMDLRSQIQSGEW